MNKTFISYFINPLPTSFFIFSIMIIALQASAIPPLKKFLYHSVDKISADIIVTGKVISATTGPLQGASVSVKNSSLSTITDANGNFTLTVPDGAILVITYVGYQQQEVSATDKTPLTISLTPVPGNLNEVVVIGYTTQRKKDLTGSVSLINNKDIANIPVGGVDQIMQGKAAGVSITQVTGAPGDGVTVRIRGTGTINNNDPLYVVDGIPTKD